MSAPPSTLLTPSTALAKVDPNHIGHRIVGNIMNARMVIQTDGHGYLLRTMQWVRLFADTELYSAKRPNYDVWGPGVSKLCAALGARVTPLQYSPNPSEPGKLRPGLRIGRDEVSGVLRSVEQDVLFECRHPQTGSPIIIIATGQVDAYHLLLGELEKLASRDDVSRLVSDRVRHRMEEDTEYDTWSFYPYSLGAWLAVNLAKSGARDAMSKHRELVREDKIIGKATSKAARLALKQSNIVPLRYTERAMLKDAAGRMYIDVPVPCWAVYEHRTRLERAMQELAQRVADGALEVAFVADDGEDLESLAEAVKPRQIDEDWMPAVDLQQGGKQAATARHNHVQPQQAATARHNHVQPQQPGVDNIEQLRKMTNGLEDKLVDAQGINAVIALRGQLEISDEVMIDHMTDETVAAYYHSLCDICGGEDN